MVQVLKEEISNRIFESAKSAFMEKGFKSATMRDIAKGASIPVGLVYSYYKNKTDLFDKIIMPVVGSFENVLRENDEAKKEKKDQSLFDELNYLIFLFEDYRDAFILLIDKSEGTKYENVKSYFIDMMEKHIKENLLTKVKEENKKMDDFFFHILASNFTESIFEIARHYKSKEWAKEMLELVGKQYFYGVNSF